MRDLSLRLPYLIYLSIASLLVGVLIAPVFRDMPPMTPPPNDADHAAMHGTLEVPAAAAPEVTVDVVKDAMSGWNVSLRTANFTFTPEAVNTDHAPGTGHAHIYVNGVKMARLYAPHAHIPDLPPGQHEITVSLSTNGHDYYTVDGNRIMASETIIQAPPVADGS